MSAIQALRRWAVAVDYEITLPADAQLARIIGWDCDDTGAYCPGTERAEDLRGQVGVVFSEEPESAVAAVGRVCVYVGGRVYIVPYELVRRRKVAREPGPHAERNALLIEIGRALYGEIWQTDIANALGVGGREVRYWVSGGRPMPAGVIVELGVLCARRGEALLELAERLGKGVE